MGKFDWAAILQWAVRHATDVPAFVSLVLAAVRAEGMIARLKVIGELFAAVQAILADFPLPTEQTYRAGAVDDLRGVLLQKGVPDADVVAFCSLTEQ